MNHHDLLRLVAGHMDRLGIDYYVTGGLAAILWGEMRHTEDINIVISAIGWKIKELCEAFPEPAFYVSVEAALDAASRGGMFNIICNDALLKLDLILCRDGEHDWLRMDRAVRIDLPGGGSARFATPEDIILKKLEYVRDHRSDKQMRDIAAIIRVRADQLDREYIDQWSLRLGVRDAWEFVRDAVDRAGPEGNV